MIIFMEQTIDLINDLPNGDFRTQWMAYLNGKLDHVFKKEVSYYKLTE